MRIRCARALRRRGLLPGPAWHEPAPARPEFPVKLAVTSFVQGFSYGAIYLAFPLAGAIGLAFASDTVGFLLAALFLVGTVFVANLNYDRLLYLGTFTVIAASYLLVLLSDGGAVAALAVKTPATPRSTSPSSVCRPTWCAIGACLPRESPCARRSTSIRSRS